MADRQKNWPRHILSTSIRMKSLNSSKQERKRSIKKSKHVQTIRSRKLLQSLISKLHLHLQVKGGGQKKTPHQKKTTANSHLPQNCFCCSVLAKTTFTSTGLFQGCGGCLARKKTPHHRVIQTERSISNATSRHIRSGGTLV